LPEAAKRRIFPDMGYAVKIQKVERPTNKSFYVNLPVALAEAIGINKGETCEWTVEDKNTLVLKRIQTKPPRKLKSNRR